VKAETILINGRGELYEKNYRQNSQCHLDHKAGDAATLADQGQATHLFKVSL
jgi:hypothetical protein